MPAEKTVIEGIVESGLGEGAFFMSMEHYRNEIKSRLGFDAYPGTLNIRIDEKYSDALKSKNLVRIEGCKSDGKTLGGASCYKAKIGNIAGYIIVPDFTKHKKGIIEFIAPVHLRSQLKIKDGTKVRVEAQ